MPVNWFYSVFLKIIGHHCPNWSGTKYLEGAHPKLKSGSQVRISNVVKVSSSLSPVQHQANAWIIAELSLVASIINTFKNYNENINTSIHVNATKYRLKYVSHLVKATVLISSVFACVFIIPFFLLHTSLTFHQDHHGLALLTLS